MNENVIDSFKSANVEEQAAVQAGSPSEVPSKKQREEDQGKRPLQGKSRRISKVREGKLAKKKNTYISKIKVLMNRIAKTNAEKSQEFLSTNISEMERKRYDFKVKKEDSSSGGHNGVEEKPSGATSITDKQDTIDKILMQNFNEDNDLNSHKLERNRESARNSRKRKKIYIELLERKVVELNEENQNLRKHLDENVNLAKSQFQSKILNTLVSERNNLFEKLEKSMRSGADQSEVDLLLDSMRLRFGANGKERVNAINYLFNQIVDIFIPLHMKYVLWIATEGKHVFDNSANQDMLLQNFFRPNSSMDVRQRVEGQDDSWTRIMEDVNLTQDQRTNMMKYRRKLVIQKGRLDNMIKTLNQLRVDILKETTSLQNAVDDMRRILSPFQVAKALMLLEKVISFEIQELFRRGTRGSFQRKSFGRAL
eukprot:TRINITY_DN974_c0_g1_i4.p1 TRINITY_DN974_c0_g1~~TRINITY_DN974_c0_g1_i4.p1  ORF type:complete len:425 (+),score=90.32 TRINITY_DN974_c0_g1_i4:58-1332(+)